MSELTLKILDYFKTKIDIFQQTKKLGSFLFTCPNIGQHKYKPKEPTATFINGSDKIGCLICFPENTYILSNKQFEKIQDLNVNTKVVNDSGLLEKINQTIKRKYTGKLINIDCLLVDNIKCTPEHPFLTLSTKQIKLKYFKDYTPTWKKANELSINDWVLMPLSKNSLKDKLKNIQIGNLNLECNLDFLRMMGLYIAEGSTSGNREIVFTFNIKEQSYIKFIHSYFKSIGLNPRIQELTKVHTCNVRICHTDFTHWLLRNCGHGSRNKQIPDNFLHLNSDERISLLYGILDGDGTQDKKGYKSYTTISKKLAIQIFYLTSQQYMYPITTRRTRFFTDKNGWNHQPAYTIQFPDYLNWKNEESGGRHFKYLKYTRFYVKINNVYYYTLKIRKIKSEQVCDIDVYNLSVNNRETYNIQGIAVHNCGWRGTLYDSVRLLEDHKKTWTDAQITEYFMENFDLDLYKELEQYVTYKWALVPIAKNDKRPIEPQWTENTHYEKVDWIKWLNNGINIGLRTGEVSEVTAIDDDSLKASGLSAENNKLREELLEELKKTDTLVQNSPHGVHYLFKYTKKLPQTVNIAGLHLDTRNDGGQILIQPSKIDALGYTFKNLGAEIKVLPEEIVSKLLELIQVDKGRNVIKEVEIPEITDIEGINKIKEGSGRNSFLLSLGGVLINKFTGEDTNYILNLVSKNFFNPPLPDFEVKNMLKSLDKYRVSEEATHEKAIYDYMKLLQSDVNAKDIMDSLKMGRALVDKYLSKFVKEGKAIRLSRGRYKFREKVEWSDSCPEQLNEFPYKIPYFNEIAHFCHGDIILLGGKPKTGKTTTAMNFIKQLSEQGLKPHYIYSESGSRHFKLAQHLGLVENNTTKFFSSYHSTPLSVEIELNTITILDWLLVGEKENTDSIFKFFTEEMERKGGILIIFMQLKENYDWYAPNMVTQFPALAARYIIDDTDTRKYGHWAIDAVREPLSNIYTVNCEFNREQNLLIKKDLI